MAQNIEQGLPIVKYNGLNTALAVDFSSAPTCALPASTTIDGSAVAGIGNITSSATSGQMLSVANTGVYAGTGIVAITSTTLTTGVALSLGTLAGLTTGVGFKVAHTTSVIADGGSLVRLSSSSIDTGGATNGTILDIGSTAQVAGTMIKTSSIMTTGTVESITSTGVMTTTGNLLTLTAASATTAAGLLRVVGTGLTSGLGLVITGTAATLTTGRYFSANDATLEVFGVGANGHLHTSQTTAPTIVVTNQAGITAAAVTAGSSDVCGNITTTGTSTGATVIDVTFHKTYTTAPKFVSLQAANAAASMPNTAYFISAIAATGFTITVPASATYAATPSWRYFVIA